jgi:hypothetical protein
MCVCIVYELYKRVICVCMYVCVYEYFLFLVSQMKLHCGNQFTSSLVGMLNDFSVMKDTLAAFDTHVAADSDGIADMHVCTYICMYVCMYSRPYVYPCVHYNN